MRIRRLLLGFIPMLISPLVVYSGEKGDFEFGKDKLHFASNYSLPDTQTRAMLLKSWNRLDPGQIETYDSHSPPKPGQDSLYSLLRDSVQYARAGEYGGLVLRDGDILSFIQWDSLGYFLKDIQSCKQCERVITLLHDEWRDRRLTGKAVRAIFQEIKAVGSAYPLKVVDDGFEDDLLSAECVERDGIWRCGFAIVEGASLVEYKYAIDQRHHIARNRRVLVEGPISPLLNGMGNMRAAYKSAGGGEWEANIRQFLATEKFLAKTAYLAQWRRALKSPDNAVRRAAASSIGNLWEAAESAIPDLVGTLRDPDEGVRSGAESALGSVGSIAVPAVRKALQDKDSDVRASAAYILGEIGDEAKDAIPDLQRALKDENENVRQMAARAITIIGQ